MKSLPAVLKAALALLVLNTLLSFGNAWPSLWPWPAARISIELAAIALALSLFSLRGALRRAVVVGTSLILTACVVLHYANVTAPAILGRTLDFYWDGQHVWEVLKMGTADASIGSLLGLAAALLGVVLGLIALQAVIRRCVVALGAGLQNRSVRAGVLGMAVLALALGTLAPRFAPPLQAAFAPSVSALVVTQADMLERALWHADDEALLGTSPRFDANLDALGGADVIIVFAEAYGAITLDNAEFAATLQQSRARFDASITASGRQVVSARLGSPTFGGGSWLAHSELLSGLDMHDPNAYRLLLKSKRPTLVRHFAAKGYRTVGWLPGIQRAWPEGRFYGFERIADADAIGYRGPAFGYWRIPDQAAMAQLQHQELDGADGTDGATRQPRLVVFPTMSTHAPFRPLAPYVPDWAAVRGADAYADAASVSARAAPVSWDEPIPAYLATLRYQFDWLSGWLAEHAPRDAVVIVIGDHQPIGTVSGPGANWEVPVHVITRNETVLERLRARGFKAGVLPAGPALGPMRALTPLLVEAFAQP
jgi:hypothetical protein